MDENRKFLLLNIIISAGIGVIVGLVELVMPNFTVSSIKVILLNALIGIAIGTTIRQFSIYAWYSKTLKQMLLSAALIMAGIMLILNIVVFFVVGPPFFSPRLLVIVLVVETLGLSWTYFSYKYYDNMNCKLDRRKQELLKSQSAGVIKLDK